jgi:hypothetical protein
MLPKIIIILEPFGLFSSKFNKEIARYNAQDVVKHKLLAKETTPFLIEFNSSNDPRRPFEMPEEFQIQVKANVATTGLSQTVAPSMIHVKGKKMTGFLFNPSIEAATIPQLLISYYNDAQELIWTNAIYIDESIRPQRKIPFQIILPDVPSPLILSSSLLNVSVNGLPNKDIAAKVNPNRNNIGRKEFLIQVDGLPYQYISITTNAYIGNPR